MIELRNLTTGYGRKTIACNLNATLHHGELVSLLGSNGVGKSTLLRTICAFQPALDGEVLIQGTPLNRLSISEQSRLISIVLTERIDVRGMTTRELVALGRSPYTGFWGQMDAEDRKCIEQAMEQVGITHLQNRNISTLSDGERQKAMIAKALAQHTPIILLDEPTAFLDFPSKVEMTRMLSRLAHEMDKVIFLSTHDVEMALQLSDRLWLMSQEGLVTGTPKELSDNGALANFIHVEGIHFDPTMMSYRIK